MKNAAKFLFIALVLGAPAAQAHELRLEAGAFTTISNRFNIPNPGGSRVWVSNDSLKIYGRLQGQIQVSENGALKLVVAPLSASYRTVTERALVFNGATIPAGSAVDVDYKFNSYRLGYVHRFPFSDWFQLQAGILGKIRDAKITVAGRGVGSAYDNVGFVPLLNVGARARLGGPWAIRLDLDGAAAKQGRAFDGALEAFYETSAPDTGLSAGVRVLEGGADNDKVNTFALIHYAFLAFTKAF